MNAWLVSTGMIACVALVSFAQVQAQPGEPADVRTVVRANNQFAADLYGRLAKEPGNLFFSPYSLSSALAMTYGGARGKTAEQMAHTLRFELPSEQTHAAFRQLNAQLRGNGGQRPFELSLANALWGQKGYAFAPPFVQLIRKDYGGTLQEVDFKTAPDEARGTINRWVAFETRDKIKDLIPAGVLGPDTRLVLTNAIYFKSAWEAEFAASATKPAPFTTTAGSKVQVPLMHAVRRTNYFENQSLQMLMLPYQHNELSLVVVLPKQAGSLAAVERDLSADRLAEWLGKAKRYEVDTFLPRFKMTAEFMLRKVLAPMGMALAFSDQADFSGMTTQGRLQISQVVHKAFIDLNEKGTEAAAATAVTIKATAIQVPQKLQRVTFRADHPFVFLIRENRTGSILFMGRLEVPK
jgi:serpin B